MFVIHEPYKPTEPTQAQSHGDLMVRVHAMGLRVLEMVERSIWALDGTNEPLARQTIVAGRRVHQDLQAINLLCVRILQRGGLDETCTQRVMSASAVASEFARTACLAESICKLVVATEEQGIAGNGEEIDQLATLALAMFRDALTALRVGDHSTALHVIHQDDEVEDRNLAMLLGMGARLSRGVGRPETYLPELRIAKHLEGVAQSARNVAGQVVIFEEGPGFQSDVSTG